MCSVLPFLISICALCYTHTIFRVKSAPQLINAVRNISKTLRNLNSVSTIEIIEQFNISTIPTLDLNSNIIIKGNPIFNLVSSINDYPLFRAGLPKKTVSRKCFCDDRYHLFWVQCFLIFSVRHLELQNITFNITFENIRSSNLKFFRPLCSTRTLFSKISCKNGKKSVKEISECATSLCS